MIGDTIVELQRARETNGRHHDDIVRSAVISDCAGIVDRIVGIRDHDDGCRLAVVAVGIVGAADVENQLIRDKS